MSSLYLRCLISCTGVERHELESFILTYSKRLMLTILFDLDETHSNHHFLCWSSEELLGRLFLATPGVGQSVSVSRVLCRAQTKHPRQLASQRMTELAGLFMQVTTDCIVLATFPLGTDISMERAPVDAGADGCHHTSL